MSLFLSICQFLLLQVEYVIMERQQESAYKEAIEEYRAVSQARMAKCSELNSKNLLAVLPRRQINNYFVQFRKVLDLCFDLNETILWIYTALFYLVIYFCILILDSKSSLVNKANLQ